MEGILREYREQDLAQMTEIWNAVVRDGDAFPQIEELTEESAREFFSSQTYAGVFEEGGEVLGLYILHPNNIGRCGHICNASFAVKKGCRGRKIGEKLVRDCMQKGRAHGFGILQFNAVVCFNEAAIRLYERLGFNRLGRIKNGFLLPDGTYTDIFPFYIELAQPIPPV